MLHRVPSKQRTDAFHAVWGALEAFVLSGHVRRLGVSGVSLFVFEGLFPPPPHHHRPPPSYSCCGSSRFSSSPSSSSSSPTSTSLSDQEPDLDPDLDQGLGQGGQGLLYQRGQGGSARGRDSGSDSDSYDDDDDDIEAAEEEKEEEEEDGEGNSNGKPIINSTTTTTSKIRIPPSIVQNAFHGGDAAAHFEADLRTSLRRRGVVFQAYHVLKGYRGNMLEPEDEDDDITTITTNSTTTATTNSTTTATHTNTGDTTTNDDNDDDYSSSSSNSSSSDGGEGSGASRRRRRNDKDLTTTVAHDLAHAAGVSPPVALYALVLGLGGTVVLDGTAREERLVRDVRELEVVGRFAEDEGGEGGMVGERNGKGGGRAVWEDCLGRFRRGVGGGDG